MQKQCEKMDAKIDAGADAMKKKKDNDDDLAEPTAADGRRSDSVSRAEFEATRAQLRDLQMKQPRAQTAADRDAYADLQARADVAFVALGEGRAPPPMSGESVIDYACRLHRPLQRHSAKWKSVELARIAADSSTFQIALDGIRAEAVQAGLNPVGLPEFQHREIHSESRGGHKIVSFVGTGSIFKQMTRPVRHVGYIGTSRMRENQTA
jgi:hypothetical protein